MLGGSTQYMQIVVNFVSVFKLFQKIGSKIYQIDKNRK